jgi:hypothetical protein
MRNRKLLKPKSSPGRESVKHIACAVNEEGLMKIRDLMKFNKIYLGLLLFLTIHTSANLAEAEDKYTLKIRSSKS